MAGRDGDLDPEGGIHDRYLVTGRSGDDGRGLPCALLAVDEAYPDPVADDHLRHLAHQAWSTARSSWSRSTTG